MSNLPLETIRWQRQGYWDGGLVTCVSAHGSICLAGSAAGLFRSLDAGEAWVRVAGRLGYEAVQALVWVQTRAYAATQTGQLWQSPDDGATWQPNPTWQYGPIQCMACAPNRDGNLTLFAGTAEGVYRSLDAGQSWQEAGFGLLDTDVLCLACAPDFAETERVWLGTAQGGLYRSRNAGRAWRESGDGLADAAVLSIALSPRFAEDQTLLVGVEGQGLFRSTDGGQHWDESGLAGQDVQAISFIAGAHACAVGTAEGLYECGDGAWLDWHRRFPESSITGLAVAQVIESGAAVLVLGTLHHVIAYVHARDVDRPTAVGEGIAAHVPPLVVATLTGSLFALDNTGLAVYSGDGGKTWLSCPFAEDLGTDSPKLLGAHANEVVVLVGANHLYRWEIERDAFVASADVPLMGKDADDEVTVFAMTDDGTLWVGSRNGLIQRRWPGSGLWEAIPAPVVGMVVDLRGTADGSGVDAVMVRSEPDGRYAAELWRLTQSASSESAWTMILALDHLPQPYARMAASTQGIEASPVNTLVLAGHNMLAIHSADGASRLVDLGAETRVTSVLPFGQGWCVGTNRGVCWVNGDDDAPTASLTERPVVALLQTAERLYAVTLGGEIWTGVDPNQQISF